MSRIPRFFLILRRLFGVGAFLVESILLYFLTVKLTGRSGSRTARAAWLQRQARQILRVLGVEATYVGQVPTEGVMVSNHISYLDIFVHAARAPMTFISKAEVAGWPVFGMLTTWAGTLYIRRERRSDVLRVAAEMPHVLQAGLVLMFFPEGTSSDGSGVLPFRASLLAPLVDNGWSVTPAFLRYELEPGEGTVADEVAYYRPETAFVPHLFHLLGKRRIRATVVYGEPQAPGTERKALARQLHDAVCELGGLVEAGQEA